MPKSTTVVVSLAFAATVAATGWAHAQVTGARTAPAGSSSAGTATRSSGSSGSPSSGGSSSSGSSGSSAPRSSGSSTSYSSGDQGARTPPAGARTPPPSSGGGRGSAPTGARPNPGHPTIGTATPNPNVGHYPPGYVYPCCGGHYPYYPYYPYYGYGYPYYGYYAPWAFGIGFGWGWPGYYGYADYSGGGGGGGESHAPSHPTGSIRLKVNVDTASVYVDGALVGKADDFDGLTSHHLVLEGGPHLLSIKADGYETFNTTLNVEIGQTLTQRITLKKK
jgi:hypothetical protein